MAQDVAESLMRADMMGHQTHGLSLLPHYLRELETGGMKKSGDVEVLGDSGASLFWNASRLPGAWVIRQAIRKMLERATTEPVVTISIAESFHIGSLQTYLKSVTDLGLVCTLSATDPSMRSVAPFGGTEPILTSNPVAYGLPTTGDPILIDLCTSVVSNSAMVTSAQKNECLAGQWLLDNQGNPTDDPQALRTVPPGTIMPLGGTDFGYKGFALGLMVEAFTLALSGYGRGEERRPFGEGVFIKILNPEFFAGRAAFEAEMSRLAERCRNSRVAAGRHPVRLPGQRALELFREAEEFGVPVSESVLELLEPWMRRAS
jgi:L-lactate dehydrogenase